MYARPLFVVVGISKAFSSEVGTGSHKENAPKQKSVPILAGFNPFRTAVLSRALASPERIRYTLAS
jgi:hypothetical protein